MTTKAPISAAFADGLLAFLAPLGYSQKNDRTFIRDVDGDIGSMLTISIDAHRARECLFFTPFVGIGSKRMWQMLAVGYGEKPKHNIPVITRPLSSFPGADRLSETPVSTDAEAHQLAQLYFDVFKRHGAPYVERLASYAAILQELREGDSCTWEDRADRRLALLAITAPQEMVDEYPTILDEGKRLNKHLERVANFYRQLKAHIDGNVATAI